MTEHCIWAKDDEAIGKIFTECQYLVDEKFMKEYKFCPYCGKKIVGAKTMYFSGKYGPTELQ